MACLEPKFPYNLGIKNTKMIMLSATGSWNDDMKQEGTLVLATVGSRAVV
jgi:hypothetical protein